VITTAKDWVKLRSLMPPGRCSVLVQRVVPEDNADAFLAAVLAAPSRSSAETDSGRAS
jgi:hypothetical protein